MTRIVAALAAILLMACGGVESPPGDDDGDEIDAATPGQLDAAPPDQPDAAPGQPDAAPGQADAGPGDPDAGPPPQSGPLPRHIVSGAGRLSRDSLVLDVEIGHAFGQEATLSGGGFTLGGGAAVAP